MRKILIIKLGAIGDVALALPLLSSFKEDEITWIVGEESAPLLRCTKEVHKLITVHFQDLLYGSLLKKLRQIFKIWKAIGFKYFDIVITAHKDPRYRLLSLFSFRKKHLFFGKKDVFPLGDLFHSRAYLNLAQKPLSPIIFPKLHLPPSPLISQKSLIILNPGGDGKHFGKALRIWPLTHYIELASLLLQNTSYEIALVGLKEHEWMSSYFSHLNVRSFIGETNLETLLSLLQKAYGLITHDGGTLHLGRAAGCRICGLFGPTSPLHFGLESNKELFLNSKISCSPCYRGKTFPKCPHQACMKTLTPIQVFNIIQTKWNSY